ncbi:MAG: PaaI family thioesterase [Planctomycetota bacterium]|nr:PaaI family thioesterase [Planctomycetota bacterium]
MQSPQDDGVVELIVRRPGMGEREFFDQEDLAIGNAMAAVIKEGVMITFDETPINKFLGLQLIQSDPSGGQVLLPDCENFIQEGGVVHGGVLSTLADTAAVYAILPHLEKGKSMTSIEFKMNFFRPGRTGKGGLLAVSKIIKGGRSVNVCESTIFQDDVELAKGTFTYLTLNL